MGELTFHHPPWLWAVPAAVVLLALLTWRSRGATRWWTRLVTFTVRGLWVTLGVLALADPVQRRTETQSAPPQVFVVEDVSASVQSDRAHAGRIKDALRQALGGSAGWQEWAFAGDVAAPGQAPADLQQTDIEQALDAVNAASLALASCQVVLLSDGRATRGSAEDAARRLALRGARVHAIPIGQAQARAPRLVSVEPPAQARVGVPTSLRLRVEADIPQPLTLRLLNAKREPIDLRTLPVEGRRTLLLRFTPQEAGVETYAVEVAARPGGAGAPSAPGSATAPSSAADPVLDRQQVAVYVEGPPRLLVVDSFPDEAEGLRRALAPLHVPVEACSPADFPAQLGAYAAVIASDWSGRELRPEQRQALRDYVEQGGGGLVFIGGQNVLASRWSQNSLADALPVVLREKPAPVVKRPPEVSVCFVLDRSGSMGAVLGASPAGAIAKLDLVKAAVLASLASLPENSQAAVVVFDTQADVVVPPTRIDQREQIAQQVDRIAVGGGTAMAPGLRQGMDLLTQMPGARYLIVLTDGLTRPPAEGPRFWSDLTAEAVRHHVSWTSIAVGRDADQRLLASLARQAGGKYVYCDRGDQIPEVFIAEAKAIKRGAEAPPQPFVPRPGPAAARLKGLALDALPELTGRVRAELRPDADALLLAEGNEPLLADWQFGLGRVAAFTSDAKPLWAKRWLAWGGFSSFWTQVVQSVMRPQHSYVVRVRSRQAGNRSVLVFQVLDDQGRPVSGLQGAGRYLDMTTSAPAAAAEAGITWRALDPGEYEAAIELPPGSDRRLVALSLRAEGKRAIEYCTLVSGTQGAELSATGPDQAALEAIAGAGHGLCSTQPADIAAACQHPLPWQHPSQRPLWPWLVIAAILLWPVDVLVRKLA